MTAWPCTALGTQRNAPAVVHACNATSRNPNTFAPTAAKQFMRRTATTSFLASAFAWSALWCARREGIREQLSLGKRNTSSIVIVGLTHNLNKRATREWSSQRHWIIHSQAQKACYYEAKRWRINVTIVGTALVSRPTTFAECPRTYFALFWGMSMLI